MAQPPGDKSGDSGEGWNSHEQWGSSSAEGADSWDSPDSTAGSSDYAWGAESSDGYMDPASGSGQYPTAGSQPYPGETPQSSSQSKMWIPLVVLVVLALAGGLAAGGWFLYNRNSELETQDAAAISRTAQAPTQTESITEASSSSSSTGATTSTSASTSATGSCEDAVSASEMADPREMFCDGKFAYIGENRTDHVLWYYWNGTSWGEYFADGVSDTGLAGPCYDRDRLVDAGASEEVLSEFSSRALFCADSAPPRTTESSSSGASAGASMSRAECDGSYALIVESVLYDPSGDAMPQVAERLAKHPGARLAYPGTCQSLRPSVNGQDIYAIYYDYGDDLAGVCAAEAQGAGNARKLQQAADYSSPC